MASEHHLMKRAFDLKNNSRAISQKDQINVLDYFNVIVIYFELICD